MMLKKFLLILTAILAITVVNASDDLPPSFVNSGFESPDLGDAGFDYASNLDTGQLAWVPVNGAGLCGPNGPFKCDSTSPDPLGDQFAYLQGAQAGLGQTLNNLQVGHAYTISFFESYRTGTAPGNDLHVILDFGQAHTYVYYSPAVTNSTWQARTSSQFIATKTSYTLTFITTNPSGLDSSTIIDGVTVNDIGLAPVMPVYPADGEKVSGTNSLEIIWDNIDPNDPNSTEPVYIDFYYGTDPNALTQYLTVADANTTTVDASVPDTYYWRVDSYIHGSAHIDDANKIEGPVYSFIASDIPSSIDVGPDMMTWDDEPVQMVSDLVDGSLSYQWTYSSAQNISVEFVNGTLDTDPTPTVKVAEVPTLVPYLRNGNIEETERTDNFVTAGTAKYPIPLQGEYWRTLDNAGNGNANRIFWPDGIAYEGAFGSAPQGNKCLMVYTRYNDDRTNYPGVRDFEAACQLLQGITFEQDVPITLSALVGRFPDTYLYNGYKLQILAGGEEVDTPGGAFDDHMTGGTVIAEIDSAVTPAPDQFLLTSVTYTPDPQVDLSALEGLPIQVRLCALEDPADHSTTSYVAFDDVQVTVGGESSAWVFEPQLTSVDMTLTVSDSEFSVSDTMSIDVYADACEMAQLGQGLSSATDLDGDCETGFGDLIIMATNWLSDIYLSDPVAK